MHLKSHDWQTHGQLILGDLIQDKGIPAEPSRLFETETGDVKKEASHGYGDVYEIGSDGAPLRATNRADSDEGPAATWESLQAVNVEWDEKTSYWQDCHSKESLRRYSWVPIHLTMNSHLDMDSVFQLPDR